METLSIELASERPIHAASSKVLLLKVLDSVDSEGFAAFKLPKTFFDTFIDAVEKSY